MAETTKYTENDAMQAGYDAYRESKWEKPHWVKFSAKMEKAWDHGWDCAKNGKDLPKGGAPNMPEPTKIADILAMKAVDLLEADEVGASSLSKDGHSITLRKVEFAWDGVRPLRVLHPDSRLSDTLQSTFVSEPFRAVFFDAFRAWHSRRLSDLCEPLLTKIDQTEPVPSKAAIEIPEPSKRRWFQF